MVRVRDIWDDIKFLNSLQSEGGWYKTQKPKALLRRIIETSSNEGDLVSDFFCGSGTTCVVAKELKRRYFGCDISPLAIKITNERLRQGYLF